MGQNYLEDMPRLCEIKLSPNGIEVEATLDTEKDLDGLIASLNAIRPILLNHAAFIDAAFNVPGPDGPVLGDDEIPF